MCDLFWQRTMESNQGDLADIVRASGGHGGPSNSHFISISSDGHLPPPQQDFLPAMSQGRKEEFGHPFANLRDPLLHEFTRTSSFLDGGNLAAIGAARPGTSGGDGAMLAQKIMSEEMSRPCNIFSRMLQISPGAVKASPLSPRQIKPSPIVSGDTMKASSSSTGIPVDHGGGVQIPCSRSTTTTTTTGIKRRKSQAKKVVCIPAPAPAGSRPTGEVIPSDLWAWRKYGQKPIKGSPYPRGYYRCSSSKGCSARKQVERSRTDPNMLVITYTSEHNHPWPTQRNALAGSTRSQPAKNSSSSSKSSSQRSVPLALIMKEKHSETDSLGTQLVKEEAIEMKMIDAAAANNDQEFDDVFDQNYKPMIPDTSPSADDFFADLAELDPDPMSLIFSKEFMGDKSGNHDETKALDPFNIFEWAGKGL